MSGRRLVAVGVLRGRRPAEPVVSALDVSLGRPVQVRAPGEDVAPAGTARVEPLLGPIDRRPVEVGRRTAAAMLLTAVEGLPLGRADEALIARWTDVLDPADAAILASLIERARVEGPAVWVRAQSVAPVGWVPVCPVCRLRPTVEPVCRAEAEQLARTHDKDHHGTAVTCTVVPVGGES